MRRIILTLGILSALWGSAGTAHAQRLVGPYPSPAGPQYYPRSYIYTPGAPVVVRDLMVPARSGIYYPPAYAPVVPVTPVVPVVPVPVAPIAPPQSSLSIGVERPGFGFGLNIIR